MKARLILENGMIFEGNAFGHLKESVGEVVFTTGMTGYQEVLTDPSYYGQIVTMTYPLIGNYGINLEDSESKSPKVKGFIVRENCHFPNNFRCEMQLDDYLKQNKIIGLQGIDTRALTKILRNNGTMKGIISLESESLDEVKEKIEGFSNKEAVKSVSTKNSYTIEGSGKHVAIIDFGIKENIIRNFKKRGCKITVFPMNITAEEVLAVNPDLIFLSNGPGDPSENVEIIKEVKKLSESGLPIFAICLGHQLMALAHGFKTEKLKYGHHGANHPVKDLNTGRVYISTQNHNYVICDDSIDRNIAKPWFINVNDQTIEGVEYMGKNIKTVQFHPEACAGPLDTDALFDEFEKMMEGK